MPLRGCLLLTLRTGLVWRRQPLQAARRGPQCGSASGRRLPPDIRELLSCRACKDWTLTSSPSKGLVPISASQGLQSSKQVGMTEQVRRLNLSALHIRWPKDWSFSFNISPSSEYSGLISFRMDWLSLDV